MAKMYVKIFQMRLHCYKKALNSQHAGVHRSAPLDAKEPDGPISYGDQTVQPKNGRETVAVWKTTLWRQTKPELKRFD